MNRVQVYDLSAQFLPKEWIMEKWEEGYYITAMAGSTGGSSLVVMSKGTPYTQQSYKVRLLRHWCVVRQFCMQLLIQSRVSPWGQAIHPWPVLQQDPAMAR